MTCLPETALTKTFANVNGSSDSGSPAEVTLVAIDDTETLVVEDYTPSTDGNITWSSTNDGAASIIPDGEDESVEGHSSGECVTTAVSAGESTITATYTTYKESYKDKKGKKNEKENILIFRDTHEAIIDRKTWYIVQELRKTVRRADSAGEVNPLTGKVFCADCGAKMHYYREGTRAGKNWKGIPDGTVRKVPGRFDCSTYNQHRDWYERACCSHSIQTNALHPIILETIQYAINSAKIDEKAFAQKLRSESEIRDKGEITKLKRQISRQERRSRELDLLIKKIYEDNAVGKLPDKRFEMLFADYDKEQQELEVTITEAKEKIGQYESDSIRLEDFLELVHKYTDVKELTGTIVNEFIDKVMVHKAEMIDGERVMEIEVYLNCIGKIDLPIRELTPEEIAEHKEKLRIRERNRLYQRKRRAKYEARIKEIVEKEEAETKRRELRKAEKAAAAMMLDPDPLKTAAVVTGEHRTEVKTGVFLTPEEAREKFGDILDEKGYLLF